MFRKIKLFLFLFSLSMILSSCGTTIQQPPSKRKPTRIRRSTVLHTVAPGETLWRIGKIYDVSVNRILRANKIHDSKSPIQMGQKLLIPGATKPLQVVTPYPSNKWKYIIIHHSATEQGSSLAFHKAHLAKGWDRGVGYHFIINNGSSDKADGFIEISPRWLKQQDGAHCKASDMNTKGIGISLVGNFNHDNVTKAQMKSLLDLTHQLQEYYKIPDRNILRHGHVEESHTDCPGTAFPWGEFKRQLRSK